MFRSAGRAVLELLVPLHCAVCGAPASAGGRWALCPACARRLAALLQAAWCPACGRRAGPHTGDGRGCYFCRKFPVRFDGAVRLGPYEGPLKRLVLGAKYGGRPALAEMLGRLLAERLALAPWADEVDLVVPVPLHWGRRLQRGFNQAEVMAHRLAAALPKVRRPARRVLVRVRATAHQTSVPAARRRRNVRGAFRVVRPGRARGRSVLLVDDVMTSGTTVAECTRVLKRAGARTVYVAVAATADFDEPGVW